MSEEHKYEELKKLGTELHIPIFEAFLDLEVRDKDGNLVQAHSQRSHSWVRNAYNWLFSQLAAKNADDTTFAAGKLSARDTGGTVRYDDVAIALPDGLSIESAGLGYIAAAANDDSGILVGSGTNAESFEDYALQTKIVDGTGSGEISHVASQAHAVTYTAGTKVLKNDMVRYFNNNSGGSIAVNEVALVARLTVASPANTFNILTSRDLLGATVTVADTGQLKVTYTIQITYPA